MVIYPAEYPAYLRTIPHTPAQLYYQGNLTRLHEPALAVVGSRALTSYGEMVCRRLVSELAQAGLVIVSGLAMGIDTMAHRAALDAGGKTIAVLGNGLNTNQIVPQSNVPLAERIVASDNLILSEYPPETSARPGYFPARNRIIAGLCLGTVVVEAAKKSGALITANFALDFNREVFAVPGSIFSSRSAGTNSLIQRGAKLVSNAQDILQELQWPIAKGGPASRTKVTGQLSLPRLRLTPRQQLILEHLDGGPLSAEQLSQLTKLIPLELMIHLTELEIQGIVRKNRTQKYEISHCGKPD